MCDVPIASLDDPIVRFPESMTEAQQEPEVVPPAMLAVLFASVFGFATQHRGVSLCELAQDVAQGV